MITFDFQIQAIGQRQPRFPFRPRCCDAQQGPVCEKGRLVRAYCDTVTVCLNETAIELGSKRTESVSCVTANEFVHLPRRYRNARTRTCLRAQTHGACSKRAVRGEPGIDA